MKILMIFIDAMRVDKLSTYNNMIVEDTVLDKYIKNMGGEVYTNCFTSSPDTYRSLASLFTGLNSWESNCDSYSKPLNPFGSQYNTIWDEALNNKFSIDIFHLPLEKYIFPNSVQKYISNEINIEKFKFDLDLKDNHIVWMGLNDFRHHSYYSNYNSNKNSENIEQLKKPLDIMDSNFIEKFDHVFLFSDHGVLFDNEFLTINTDKKFQILDHRRTQLLMVHKEQKLNTLKHNNKLYYLSDMHSIISNAITKIENKIELDREYLIVEDMDFASMDLSSKPSIFSLVTKKEIYIRSFLQKIGTSNSGPSGDKAFLLNRQSLNGSLINIIPDKDDVLFTNNNFNSIYKIYNFWMNQKITNEIIREELQLPYNSDPDSMGNPIRYSTQFSIFSIGVFIQKVTPPILFDFIKSMYKRIMS